MHVFSGERWFCSSLPEHKEFFRCKSLFPFILRFFYSYLLQGNHLLRKRKLSLYLNHRRTHQAFKFFVTFKPSPPVSGLRMHEWALAESIVLAVVEAAQKEKLKAITEVTVQIGELQQIEKEIFLFALHELAKSQKPKIKNNAFQLKTQKSTLTCKTCGGSWKYSDMKKKLSETESESIHFIPEVVFVHARCPHCGSPDFEITQGRGVMLTSIKGVR